MIRYVHQRVKRGVIMAVVFTFENGKQIFFDRTVYANGEYVLFKDYQLLDEERRAVRDQLIRANNQIDDLKEQIAKLEKTRSSWADNAVEWREKHEKAEKKIKELEHELRKKADSETDRLVKLPFDALETANMLINATYKAEIPFLERKVDRNVYDIDDLEQIAEHLLVYCKHNRDGEE